MGWKKIRRNFSVFCAGNKSSRKAKLFVQLRRNFTTMSDGQEKTRQEKGCESRQKEEVTSALLLLFPQRRLSEPAFFCALFPLSRNERAQLEMSFLHLALMKLSE